MGEYAPDLKPSNSESKPTHTPSTTTETGSVTYAEGESDEDKNGLGGISEEDDDDLRRHSTYRRQQTGTPPRKFSEDEETKLEKAKVDAMNALKAKQNVIKDQGNFKHRINICSW